MSSTTTPSSGLRKPLAAELYHSDGYSWAIEQADTLRRRDFAAVDWDNVIEEIKDVGKAEVRSWTSYCARTIEHLLKIEHYRKATDEELKHWSQEVSHFRIRMARIIRKNPGLQGEYESMFADAWEDGRDHTCHRLADYDQSDDSLTDRGTAYRHRNLTLPQDCPYKLEDVTAFQFKRDSVPRHDVWPPEVARILNTRLHTNYPARYERT